MMLCNFPHFVEQTSIQMVGQLGCQYVTFPDQITAVGTTNKGSCVVAMFISQATNVLVAMFISQATNCFLTGS